MHGTPSEGSAMARAQALIWHRGLASRGLQGFCWRPKFCLRNLDVVMRDCKGQVVT